MDRERRPALEEAVFISLLRTADSLQASISELFKPRGISPVQYNVLRILRGAGAAGLPCGEIGARLITRDPDVTRLLDRLENRGLISRSRGEDDRRVVKARITGTGLALLEELDEPVVQLHRRDLGEMGQERLRTLLELLEQARAHVARTHRGEQP